MLGFKLRSNDNLAAEETTSHAAAASPTGNETRTPGLAPRRAKNNGVRKRKKSDSGEAPRSAAISLKDDVKGDDRSAIAPSQKPQSGKVNAENGKANAAGGSGKTKNGKRIGATKLRATTTADDDVNGKSANGKSANGKSANGKSVNGNGANGNGANGKSTNGKDANGASHAGPRPGAKKRALPVMQDDGSIRGRASDSDLRFRLASLLRVSDNLVSKAVAAYDRLFSLESSDESEIYLQMGKEFLASNRLHEALKALRRASQLDAENATAFAELGIVHVRLRAPVAAIQNFERAQHLGAASYRLQKFFGEALIMQERHVDAARELERAVRLAPDSADAWFRFGNALDLAENHDEAIEAFQMCVELDPHTIEYQQRLGFAFESAGRRSDAVKCFKRALVLEHETGERTRDRDAFAE